MAWQAKKRGVTLLLLLAILALAAVFRFWQLAELPPGLYHDEAYNGLDALSLTQGKTFPQFYEGWELYAQDAHAQRPPQETRFPIFFEGNYGREPLHVYLMALAVAQFGATPWAIRAVPAAAGVLAVLTTFFAARALLAGRHVGEERPPTTWRDPHFLVPLLAAFTLAVLYPAVHFSRFGIRAMVFVPVETLAVACFWYGVNRAGSKGTAVPRAAWLWLLAAGFFLGLGLYTFAAARLLPLLWLLFVPLWFWRDRAALRRFWRPVAAMAAAALVTALPLLLFFARYPYFFVFRIAYVANKGRGAVEGQPLLTWLLNVGRVVRGLFWLGETHLRHNLPGRPFLDAFQAGFFLVGLLATLRRAADPRRLFLLLWFGVMLLPSIMSGDAPHFGRLIGAAAPAAILVALGAAWLLDQAARRLSGRATAAVALLLLGLFALSGLWTARDYFGRYAAHPDLARDFYLPDWQLGQFAAAQPPQTDLYLTPTQEELATIYFALQDPARLRNYSGAAGLIPAGRPQRPALYLLRPPETAALAHLQAFFPDGVTDAAQSNFIPFTVPAAAPRLPDNAPAAPPATFAGRVALRAWTAARAGDQLRVTLYWEALAPVARDYTAFVHVLDAGGNLVAQQDRPPAGYPTSDWRPGEIVVDTYVVDLPPAAADATYRLETGFYYLPTLEPLGETAVLR